MNNIITKLQELLNDQINEVYNDFRKSGKCYDFSLLKEVSADDISEEHYNFLIEHDNEDEIVYRIMGRCPWCDDIIERDNLSDNYMCVGVSSDGKNVYGTIFNSDINECRDIQLYNFNSDVASLVFRLMYLQ
jgi:hypothetical protein